MASRDHCSSRGHDAVNRPQPVSETKTRGKKRTKRVRTFADDAAANAFGASPVATSLKPRPRAPHARMRTRTQNTPMFCDRSHSLTVQRETTRRAFENTISVATRPDTLQCVGGNGFQQVFGSHVVCVLNEYPRV